VRSEGQTREKNGQICIFGYSLCVLKKYRRMIKDFYFIFIARFG